jgi:hypothetical protein
MRVLMIGSFVLGCSLACGGAESTDLFSTDGGTTNNDGGGNGNDSGGNHNDSGTGNDSGIGNDGGNANCQALQAQLDQLRTQATSCLNTSGPQPCGKFIQDFCCQLTVSDDNSQASKAFEQAFNAFKNQCQPPICPGTPCRAEPSKVCTTQSPQQQQGHCQQ